MRDSADGGRGDEGQATYCRNALFLFPSPVPLCVSVSPVPSLLSSLSASLRLCGYRPVHISKSKRQALHHEQCHRHRGRGFAGLATAIRLQAGGHQVRIIEKRAKIGGRSYQLIDRDYVFDMGPSLITAPDLIDAVFASAG